MEPKNTYDLELLTRGLWELGPSWKKAKCEWEGIKEVAYTDLRRKASIEVPTGGVIQRTFDKIVGGGCSGLFDDEWYVDYAMRCDMERGPRYDSKTIELSFRVKWEHFRVDVSLYSGNLSPLMVHSEMLAMINETKVRDLTKFAQMTRLDVDDVFESPTHEVNELLKLISCSVVGQNKLTRLVKGFLLYLDRLEKGPVRVTTPAFKNVKYNVKDILRRANSGEEAYVFVDDDNSHVYGAILGAMCQAYPNPWLGGTSEIAVPADGKHIFLVSHDGWEGEKDVIISAQLVWATLVMYCNQFRLGNELDVALAIACSLRENRYLKRVYLPRVHSYCDLLYPFPNNLDQGVGDKSLVNLAGARLLGRIHQMLCLLTFKEVDYSFTNGARVAGEVDRTIISELSMDPFTIMEYMDGKCSSDLLKFTQQMFWLNKMDACEMEHIRKFSVFEGLWLISYLKEVLKGGVLKCLKQGLKNGLINPFLHVDSFSTMLKEASLLGDFSQFNCPDGGYHIGFSVLRRLEREVRPKITFTKKGVRQWRAPTVSCGGVDEDCLLPQPPRLGGYRDVELWPEGSLCREEGEEDKKEEEKKE